MFPVRQLVSLEAGAVMLRAWGGDVVDAHLLDLLQLTHLLGELRDDWDSFTEENVTPAVWGRFWRLVEVSLVPGQQLPAPDQITWADRVRLLETMWSLNDLQEIEGKLNTLIQRARQRKARALGQGTVPEWWSPIAPWTSTSFGSSEPPPILT